MLLNRYKQFTQGLVVVLLLGMMPGCLSSGGKERKQPDDVVLFTQGQKAFDAREYTGAIESFDLFYEQFPDSQLYSWALQRQGEAFEGLLEVDYREPVEDGAAEPQTRRTFLEKHGHYGCWKESATGLAYDGSNFRRILNEFPDSPIADEAAYRLVAWMEDYRGRPDGPLKEIQQLEEVLEQYPTTSFRYEILYKMAYRCHVLYEMYAFSPRAGVRDSGRADQYRSKALYLYKLSLNAPNHSPYSQKAWSDMRKLEENRRVYISE